MKTNPTLSSEITADDRFVLCPSCGSPEFVRVVEEEGTIVRLIDRPTGIIDDVVREGEQQFVYRCNKCGAELHDVDITATGQSIACP